MAKYIFPKWDENKPSKDIKMLHPIAQKHCQAWMDECHRQGIPVIITCTWRSEKYQNILYSYGRSGIFAHKRKITNAFGKTSIHFWHLAWDWCLNINGDCYNLKLMNKAIKIAQRMGITSGADWDSDGSSKDENFVDRPHMEFTGGLSYAEIFAGKIPTKYFIKKKSIITNIINAIVKPKPVALIPITKPIPTPIQKTKKVKVLVSSLNIREKADAKSRAIGGLKKNDIVDVLGESNGFYKIKQGWISKGLGKVLFVKEV